MRGTQEQGWQHELARGDSSGALQRYLTQDNQDEDTLGALRALNDMCELLRAKRWKKAQRQLETFETRSDVVHWSLLSEQITVLEESNRLLDERKPEEALERLRLVEQPLLQAEANTQRGTAHIFMNDLEAANSAFASALDNDPRHYRALTNRGNLALEDGRIDEAIADYEAALKINESFSNAYHNLGVAYRRKGQVGKSVQSIRRAQRALRREDSEQAREALKSMGKRAGRRWGKYLFYALVLLVAFFILRSQGIF